MLTVCRCKTAAEAYPEGFPHYAALTHAQQISGLADDPRLKGLEDEITGLAEMITYAAMNGLSSVQHQDVLNILDEAENAGAEQQHTHQRSAACRIGLEWCRLSADFAGHSLPVGDCAG